MVSVHGVLRCQSVKCQQSIGHSSRYWNRDDAATANMKAIVEGLLARRGIPARFKRMKALDDFSSVVYATQIK